MKKIKTFKGHIIAFDKQHSIYYIFTKEEWSYGPGIYSHEWETQTLQEAEEWLTND